MDKRNKTAVSDISFVELASSVQTIEVQASLKQIPDAAVSSFYFGKLGLDNLIRKKYDVLHDLVTNKSRLTVFIGSAEYPLDGDIAIVATSMLNTLEDAIKGVREQISRGIGLRQYEQSPIEPIEIAKELINDELPF